jgi:hypothetical protein
MTLPELRVALQQRRLDPAGKRRVLVERMKAWAEAQPTNLQMDSFTTVPVRMTTPLAQPQPLPQPCAGNREEEELRQAREINQMEEAGEVSECSSPPVMRHLGEAIEQQRRQQQEEDEQEEEEQEAQGDGLHAEPPPPVDSPSVGLRTRRRRLALLEGTFRVGVGAVFANGHCNMPETILQAQEERGAPATEVALAAAEEAEPTPSSRVEGYSRCMLVLVGNVAAFLVLVLGVHAVVGMHLPGAEAPVLPVSQPEEVGIGARPTLAALEAVLEMLVLPADTYPVAAGAVVVVVADAGISTTSTQLPSPLWGEEHHSGLQIKRAGENAPSDAPAEKHGRPAQGLLSLPLVTRTTPQQQLVIPAPRAPPNKAAELERDAFREGWAAASAELQLLRAVHNDVRLL